jgi:hypothetical protein
MAEPIVLEFRQDWAEMMTLKIEALEIILSTDLDDIILGDPCVVKARLREEIKTLYTLCTSVKAKRDEMMMRCSAQAMSGDGRTKEELVKRLERAEKELISAYTALAKAKNLRDKYADIPNK